MTSNQPLLLYVLRVNSSSFENIPIWKEGELLKFSQDDQLHRS